MIIIQLLEHYRTNLIICQFLIMNKKLKNIQRVLIQLRKHLAKILIFHHRKYQFN